MKALATAWSFITIAVKVLRLALPKIGVGWMFALLTVNFNRVTIHDLSITAILITSMIGFYHFLSPFQVLFGRLADRRPILGWRRTPYFLFGYLIAGLIFLALPGIAVDISQGSWMAVISGFILLIGFGVGLAASGSTHLAIIADNTTKRSRGLTVAVVWTVMIGSTIASAVVMKRIMPVFDLEAMQQLYNLTPLVVMASALPILGMERRLKGAQLQEAIKQSKAAAPEGSTWRAGIGLMRNNPSAAAFFGFIFLSIMGIFVQDAILEVFGADVFEMSVAETTAFQQYWGSGALLGMLGMGIVSAIFPIGKRTITVIGGSGTALGLFMLALTSAFGWRFLLNPTLIIMGFSTGCFNVGALSLMMEMSVEGATATYMGLWGMAQSLANGSSSIVSGGLHTALIETGLFSSGAGFSFIFAIEGCMLLLGLALLQRVHIEDFQGLTRQDLTRAMEMVGAD